MDDDIELGFPEEVVEAMESDLSEETLVQELVYYKSIPTQHNMKIHAREKQFTCNDCQAQFSRKPDLTRHMKIHAGEKQFTGL